MKKALIVVIAMVMGLSMTASALPAVTDDGSCALKNQLGMAYGGWVQVLQAIDGDLDNVPMFLPLVEQLATADFFVTDFDFTGAGFGDGIPEFAQIALLANAACADAEVAAALQANVDEMTATLAPMAALLEWGAGQEVEYGEASGTVDSASITQLATDLNAFAATLVGTPFEAAAGDIVELAGYLVLMNTELIADLAPTEDIAVYTSTLNGIKGGLAALGTMGAVNAALPEMVLGMLLAGLNEEDEDLGGLTPGGVVAMIGGGLADVAETLAGVGQAELATRCALTSVYCANGAAIMGQIAGPDFTPFVAAKAANEPFAADGDYNGNGDTNLQVWQASGNSVAAFVANASGANVYYEGNPSLPAAGLVGLAALIGALSAGGACILRKK